MALAVGSAPALAAPATDGPGAMSHFDLARKDCVGTALTDRSKVWFTVADGVLSDVYYPTNDNTNNETLQYIVTDGSTFTDLQTRDMTYTVQALDKRALTCRVVATAKSRKYRITTDFLTDSNRPAVILHSRFEALKGRASDYRVYARFDPTLNGNGGGGSGNGGPDTGATQGNVLVGSDTVTATNAANRDYAQPVFSALDGGFTEVSNGYAGAASDGLKQLDTSRKLTNLYTDAAPGNLTQTGKVALGHDGTFTLALAFGSTAAQAVGTAKAILHTPLWFTALQYLLGWHRYDNSLVEPKRPKKVDHDEWENLLDTYYVSANYVKAATDKTFPGATSAAMASPWGQAIAAGDPANTYFGSYREVFARDLYEAWTAAYLDGDRKLATDMTRFLFERQQLPDGSMPRNSLTNGKQAPDSFNTQLDECAYPLVMALAVGLTGKDYYSAHIKPAANFVATHGPSFGPERWEEQDGYSPSTISAEIAGLVAAARIADMNGDKDSAAVWRGVADEFQRNLKTWTLTTNGPASPQPYFIRLSKTGDPNAAITYNVGNGGPTLDQRAVIDAGFLEYARLGLMKANDPDIVRSLKVVDATIKRSTVNGDGFYRYNGDGYGDGSTDGHPWAPSNKGNGHLWPVLSGERGQWEVSQGDTGDALKRAKAMAAMAYGVGLIPEQAWELPDLARSPFGTDPTIASIGFTNGESVGSAAALTWSAAQFVRLMLVIGSGDPLDRPAETYDRYVKHTQGTTALTVTGPPDKSPATGSTTVTGTSTPGNTITVSAVNQDDHTSLTRTATVPSSGAFSIPIPLTGGTTVLNIVATSKSGGTARAIRTVVFDFAPGTLLFSKDDPDGDDNGPGNFAYPTSSNFKPGAYDLQRFEVYDAGDRIIFRVRTRDLSPTFGSPLGAQLVDVYVSIPGASPTSTSAAFTSRNYTLATPWAKRIEVQGFGQQYVDASGATLGQVNITGNEVSRYITFSVTKASLGTPASGWGFAVVLTGQDGFSSDQARGFQSTPQDFQFGVCATASSDPHCTVNPGTVPKAMDTFTPPAELDYTLHPVVLTPVTIP
ncbi:glucodextranase DOMON-like domain-containing protein [Solirubrobacter soli]|uniref:glucodextranase DOMON-like domain-containing protein n=1 Tax=Solirubrobacter soli TaxID=363832 RepID=UPI00069D460B|nr:glucodextranase DOMON-like domain-containing protein [Solirubrobacter soli]